MKRFSKKQLVVLIIFSLFVLGTITADLVMFNRSLKENGVGRGFSRYWSSHNLND